MNTIRLQSIVVIFNNMFITNEAHRSPLAAMLDGAGDAYWRVVELALNKPWFIVSILQTEQGHTAGLDEGFPFVRTLLIGDIADLLSLLMTLRSEAGVLRTVHSITPSHINETRQWQMEQLAGIWTAKRNLDGHESAIDIEILETVAGKLYTAFPTETSIRDRSNLTLLVRLPTETH